MQPADVTQRRLIRPPVPRSPRPHPVGPRRLPSPEDRIKSGGARRGTIRIRRHEVEKARQQTELAQRQATEDRRRAPLPAPTRGRGPPAPKWLDGLVNLRRKWIAVHLGRRRAGTRRGEKPSHGLPTPRTSRRPRAPPPRLRARPGIRAGAAPPARPRPRLPPGPRPRARSPGWPPSPPQERARFNALPERSRARFLEWHRERVNPDPILAGEAARLLRPKGRSAASDEPDGTFALTGEPAHPRRSPKR